MSLLCLETLTGLLRGIVMCNGKRSRKRWECYQHAATREGAVPTMAATTKHYTSAKGKRRGWISSDTPQGAGTGEVRSQPSVHVESATRKCWVPYCGQKNDLPEIEAGRISRVNGLCREDEENVQAWYSMLQDREVKNIRLEVLK